MRHAFLISGLIVPALVAAAPAVAQDAKPVLNDPAALARIGREGARYPMIAADLARTRAEMDAMMRGGISVPVPKDSGGGATHEQHKRNYKAIYSGGLLYRITGERRYAEYARDLLLAYAKLYPTLGKHPAASNQVPGRLFWQSLNDSVWLVYGAQGYDLIRDTLTPADRQRIDDDVFRRMARYLSTETAASFDRIHNHATWAAAGVGMTGYVLRDRNLVDMALKGSDRSGKSGFLRQLDLLFSPDGYYAEGPYYQRYALQPFVMFAAAIAANDPAQRIFEYRGGIVTKAVTTAIQATYDGHFFPINDALPEKSLKTEELYQGVAIAYAATGDPTLLSIAQWQGRTVLTPEGFAVARDLAAGKAKPFPFRSMALRDGPAGDRGALAILRSGPQDDAQVVVAKNTAQGMGHGHFDKLNWLFYDHGDAVVTDYGAVRFLNIEAKDGGKYLPENDSYGQQTIAHNTLVRNETSHFGAKLKPAEAIAPTQLYFGGDASTMASTGEVAGAYPGVTMRRTLVQFRVGDAKSDPLVLDVIRATGGGAAMWDLPLHYAGQLIDTGFTLRSNVTTRPLLGKANGYQHLWVDATASARAADPRVTWMTDGRFYTWRTATPEAQVLLVESGANDPKFNLRREPAIVQRLENATDPVFVTLLEPHGSYDASSEMTVASDSAVTGLTRTRGSDAEIVVATLKDGRRIAIGIADDAGAKPHSATVAGRRFAWTGHIGRLDMEAAR
ncbi:heparinase II/III family protein [Sphingomonas donggukensis]|uniref:Heparinase II/III family protein n=1 Tax=Sphingomonas donggukensis TaxID=2949093 RepID=A0ABY4TWN1_9SPHN|nr:heparinase II/III family protein [Sphingomonas donggukensis]URW74713.1 heparinase II/III family protein [Sphingomonas donggukensis]